MTPARAGMCAALLAAAGSLGGCVAVALPLIGAGAVVRSQLDPADDDRATRAPARSAPARAAVSAPAFEEEEAQVQLTTLTELPPPSPGRSDIAQRGIAAFSAYVTQQMQLDGGMERREAVLAEPGSLDPTRRDCGSRKPAVLIDLDPGRGTFDPLGEATPAPALPETLAMLREEAIAVAWQSRLGRHFETAARDRLRAAGLDPAASDTLLFARTIDERKQTLRDEFAEMHCILAILGDERADFDELYLYLKDPDAAIAPDALIGDGWFLTGPIENEA